MRWNRIAKFVEQASLAHVHVKWSETISPQPIESVSVRVDEDGVVSVILHTRHMEGRIEPPAGGASEASVGTVKPQLETEEESETCGLRQLRRDVAEGLPAAGDEVTEPAGHQREAQPTPSPDTCKEVQDAEEE